MATPGQIGIYWGEDSFSIVEVINDQISNILKLPFDTEIQSDQTQKNIPDALKFPAILKKTLEFRSIKSKDIHLSLPTNDLIFRSFMIPVMDKTQINNVIEFEITKYIPLKLEDLIYTYHTMPQVENKQKNLRVLFIAVRKTKLEEMVKTIDDAGLTLKHIEPSPISLMHLFKKQKFLSKNESTAILKLGKESTEIIVLRDETLSFMRKLNILLDQTNLITLQNTLLNEVRVSFNFFKRQNPTDHIAKLIIISEHTIPNIEETLSKDLNIPTTFIPIEKFIPINDQQSISHLNALGATQRKGSFSTKFFDLSAQAIQMQRSGKDPLEAIHRYGTLAGIILGCAATIFLTFFLGNKMLASNKAKVLALNTEIGSFASLSITDLQTKKDQEFNTLKNFTTVRTQSQMSFLLSEIPKHLPEGAWLESFQIEYNKSATDSDPNVKISLIGNIFSQDSNRLFSILNEFITKLKETEPLKNFYGQVTRSKADLMTLDGYPITKFIITCDYR